MLQRLASALQARVTTLRNARRFDLLLGLMAFQLGQAHGATKGQVPRLPGETEVLRLDERGRKVRKSVWARHHDHAGANSLLDAIHAADVVDAVAYLEMHIEAQGAAEAARRDAFTDPLTGLPNRRLLDAVLASRKDDLDRHRLPFGLLIADVDHFKWFNDTRGHDVGDQALKVIAATLRAAARGGDSVTRWGGEEFAIVAAQVDGAGLARVAERMLALIRAARVPVPTGNVPVRASIGTALAVPGEPLEALFKRADDALMAAKSGGRDRAILSTPVDRAGGPRVLGAARGPR